MGLKWTGFVAGLAVLAVLGGSQVTFAGAARTAGAGMLVLSGGVRAAIKLSPANCVIGPGNTFSVNAVNRGGWDSLFFSASDPGSGRPGTAQVSLQGTQYSGNDAVEVWGWIAKKNSGHLSSRALKFTASGKAGAITTVLPVLSNYLGPMTIPVDVKVSWSAGTCKPGT